MVRQHRDGIVVEAEEGCKVFVMDQQTKGRVGGSLLKDRRIIILVVVVLALASLDLYYGLHFGIEFVGGTQIPVTLAHGVNVTAMSSLITSLQERLSTFGLQQVTVEGIGDSQLYITTPSATPAQVNQTLSIIEAQGRFDGVVAGRDAINGSSILKGSIGYAQPVVSNGTVTWQVNFYITQAAEKPFSIAVFGQGNQPLNMFLDRPEQTAILIDQSWLGNSAMRLSQSAALKDMQSVLSLGNQTIPVITFTNTGTSIANAESFFLLNQKKYKTILASADTNQSLVAYLKSLNYTVSLESQANMTPNYVNITINSTEINSWPLVGLVSAPILSPALTTGNVSSSYDINGAAPLSVPPAQRVAYATNQSKTIASVLSGGALPVAVIAGTPTTIPATLGSRFLYISGLAGLIAVILVSLFITIRYRKLFLIAPILLTTAMELFIIVSIIGLIGTIDLAAVAGMIAVIGTGVDAQVIITDEIIAKKVDLAGSALLSKAFYIVWTDAALLVIAMVPLFLSTSLVTVIGFSEATIFGALLSVFITRPAYGAIISKRYA
jgi:preprotein translocase subunit SecD